MRELDLANVDEARAKDKLSARIAQINLLSRASLSSCQLLFSFRSSLDSKASFRKRHHATPLQSGTSTGEHLFQGHHLLL